MPHYIIKQPDGLFCIYSSVVDAFIIQNAVPSEIINSEQIDNTHLSAKKVEEVCLNIINCLNKGIDPYNGFSYDYETAKENDKIFNS